jgi:hypothetical protein
MPVIKENFELKYDDILKLNKALINFQGDKEKTINDCLRNNSSPRITKSVTDFLPVSEKGKRHAKDNSWYEQTYYNLSFVLSNSLKGKRGKSFYYLYYPVTGTGNSYKKGPNDFLGKGMNKEYDNVVEELLNALNTKLEEEINNE